MFGLERWALSGGVSFAVAYATDYALSNDLLVVLILQSLPQPTARLAVERLHPLRRNRRPITPRNLIFDCSKLHPRDLSDDNPLARAYRNGVCGV